MNFDLEEQLVGDGDGRGRRYTVLEASLVEKSSVCFTGLAWMGGGVGVLGLEGGEKRRKKVGGEVGVAMEHLNVHQLLTTAI